MSTRTPPSSRPSRQPTRGRNTPQGARGGRQVPVGRSRRQLWLLIGIPLALILLAAFLFLRSSQTANLNGVVEYTDLSRDHDDQSALTYPETPPVGGIHRSSWQNCGIYSEPIPNEFAVHSLEHGAVWITYRPDLPAEEVEELRRLATGRSHVLVSPYPDLPAPIVASAWGVQLKIEGGTTSGIGSAVDGVLGRSGQGTASDSRLAMFVERYERGRQTPEPGASCRGGNGTPTAR